jgi:hypothetical protein
MAGNLVGTTATEAIGRIVSASLQSFEADCFQLDGGPALGTLVVTTDGQPAIYGVVSSILTQGADPSRPIAPHGSPDEDLATVRNRHPHLPILLRTTFISLVVANERSGALSYRLPDRPAPLLARIRACTIEETARFVRRLDFLEPLVQRGEATDDVVAALLRRLSGSRPDARAFLLEAGRALVPILAGESARLAAILRRIRP